MAAPQVIIGGCDHAGPHGIKVNIADKLHQIGVRIQQDRLVTPLKYVSGSGLGIVDPFRIAKRKVLHDTGQRHITGLDDEMDMVCHEAKSVDAADERLYDILQEDKHSISVAVVEKDRLTGVTAEHNMVDCAGKMYAGFTCHGGILKINGRKSNLTPKTPDPKDAENLPALQKLLIKQCDPNGDLIGNFEKIDDPITEDELKSYYNNREIFKSKGLIYESTYMICLSGLRKSVSEKKIKKETKEEIKK